MTLGCWRRLSLDSSQEPSLSRGRFRQQRETDHGCGGRGGHDGSRSERLAGAASLRRRLGRPGLVLAVVHLVVPLEVVALDKALPTLVALVRALSSVRAHVGREDTVLLERLVANRALLIPVLRVCLLVLPQMAGCSRLEIATRLRADVRLQVRVHQLVVLELALRCGGRGG